MMTSSPEPVEWLTSGSDPMRVDWVDLARAGRLARFIDSGARLGMTFLPGKFHDAPPLHLYRRDLETDVAALRDAHGVETLLLLVQDGEIERARVADLPDVLAAHDIELLRFPTGGHQRPRPENRGRQLRPDHHADHARSRG
jgi:hypothetical protein